MSLSDEIMCSFLHSTTYPHVLIHGKMNKTLINLRTIKFYFDGVEKEVNTNILTRLPFP